MKEKINKILWDFAQSKLTHEEATQQVLDLFAVVGRSEQLCRTFFPDGKTTSATKCQFCGKEKWEH
jgi:hypothetical protein